MIRWIQSTALLFLLITGALTLPATAQDSTSAESGDTANAEAPEKKAPKEGAPEQAAPEDSIKTPDTPMPKADQANADGGWAKSQAAKAKAKLELAASQAPKDPGDTCEGGVAFDDGKPETGYGFVPSAAWGEYVQRFDSNQFPSRQINKVCVCWAHTGSVADLDFEVVFFEDAGGRPKQEAYASAAGRAENTPKGAAAAGRFYPVEVKDVTIPEGPFYIGVRYDPGAANRVFVCTDKSETSTTTLGFQREDRAKGWDNLLASRDSLFNDHKALLIRATAAPAEEKAKEAEAGEEKGATD